MQVFTIGLSMIAVVTMLLAAILDSVFLGAVGLVLLLAIIILIIFGLRYWGWESGNEPGGMGGP